MEMKEEEMDLNAVRNKINRIDYEIVKLLNERLELSVRTRKLKKQVKDQGREQEVIQNISRFSHGLVEKDLVP